MEKEFINLIEELKGEENIFLSPNKWSLVWGIYFHYDKWKNEARKVIIAYWNSWEPCGFTVWIPVFTGMTPVTYP